MLNRRQFLKTASLLTSSSVIAAPAHSTGSAFRLRYVLSSAMYGEMPLEFILPEVARTGSEAIDIWCRVHGNQREQVAEMGDEKFAELLQNHGVRLGVSTRYPLGPLRLQNEMAWVKKMGGNMVVCGSTGPKAPQGFEAKTAIQNFIEEMKPHVAKAEELGIRIAIENHSGQAVYHPDSLRYFADFNQSVHLGIAFAPHHLHRWADQIPQLLRDLGDRNVPFIYLQEYSEAMQTKMAKEIEMKQLPGFGGSLDYKPIVAALRDIQFRGYVEIFMEPVPRGTPILPTVGEITAAINKSRNHVENCLNEVL